MAAAAALAAFTSLDVDAGWRWHRWSSPMAASAAAAPPDVKQTQDVKVTREPEASRSTGSSLLFPSGALLPRRVPTRRNWPDPSARWIYLPRRFRSRYFRPTNAVNVPSAIQTRRRSSLREDIAEETKRQKSRRRKSYVHLVSHHRRPSPKPNFCQLIRYASSLSRGKFLSN